MNISQAIVGILMILGGLVLVFISVINWIIAPLFWGIPLVVIGLIIFFNRKEDSIEQIKKIKGRK